MSVKVEIVYFVEVTSSWCYWAEPAWAELKTRFANEPVTFDWKIALLDESGLPSSEAQLQWFYRRSGMIVRSPFMLNSGWYEAGVKEYLAPNCVAEAAKDMGIVDDRVRLAVAHAGLREGRKICKWDIAVQSSCDATGLQADVLMAKAKSPEIEKRVRASTAEFHAMQATQRPTFLLKNNIGDRAMFCGLAKAAPIAAAIESMLDDARAYAAHAAHFGAPPA
jgi:predicted DsbA family dithiol-disulfide isomerase